MPAKKVVSFVSSPFMESKENTLNTHEDSYSSNIPSFPNLLILGIIMIFTISLTLEAFAKVNDRYSITDTQAKSCMLDFQDKHCNTLSMGEECSKIYKCIQRISNQDVGILEKIQIAVPLAFKILKQQGFLPACLIVLILLYQIARAIKQKDVAKPQKAND